MTDKKHATCCLNAVVQSDYNQAVFTSWLTAISVTSTKLSAGLGVCVCVSKPHAHSINHIYRKTSNIIRTFFTIKLLWKSGCVLYIGLDIFCSLFQIETIVKNETAALQRQRRRRRKMSIRVAGEWASWLWTVVAETVAAAGGGGTWWQEARQQAAPVAHRYCLLITARLPS